MTSGIAADDSLSPGPPTAADDVCSQKRINENNRRSNKPIMEKKRRARINNCLNELKTLILDATKKDPARHSKLEKADILEMTVKHLESMQRHNATLSAAAGSTVANKFKAGFTECTNEVSRFPGLEPHVRKRLMQHLGTYFDEGGDNNGGDNNNNDNDNDNNDDDDDDDDGTPSTVPEQPGLRLRLDRNAILLDAAGSARGLELVPTRLANGDIALVLPSGRAGAAVAPSPVPAVVATAAPPSECSGPESPAPDSPSSSSSCCSTTGSCDSADAYGRTARPLASVAKRGRDDGQSDVERPWRPW